MRGESFPHGFLFRLSGFRLKASAQFCHARRTPAPGIIDKKPAVIGRHQAIDMEKNKLFKFRVGLR